MKYWFILNNIQTDIYNKNGQKEVIFFSDISKFRS